MMSLEQAIEQYDGYANVCKHHNLTVSQKEFEQLAAWLRELQERRKAPEIITCGECAYRYVEGNHVRFNRCELNHNNVQSDDWYCGDAERRTND